MVADRNMRFLFHGWTRLCLHAASLNAAEGASSAATAAARAARAEAEQLRTATAISSADTVKEEEFKERHRWEEELKRRRAKAVVRGPRLAHMSWRLQEEGTKAGKRNIDM